MPLYRTGILADLTEQKAKENGRYMTSPTALVFTARLKPHKNTNTMASSTTASSSVVEDDWNLPLDFFLFAQHQIQHVHFPHNPDSIKVECVEHLTPLDMMNLSNGVHDATCHCVWTGAFLLIEVMNDLESYMQDKVIELGSGTGIGGLAVAKMSTPSSVVRSVLLTDADPEALALCQRNIEHNNLQQRVSTCQLAWGEALSEELEGNFQTVLATDVLYDIGLLPKLLKTAHDCLSSSSSNVYFILSHVPRACYNSENPPVESLEDLIVDSAKAHGFELERVIRPMHDNSRRELPKDALNYNVSLEELNEIGAAVFVFRKVASLEGGA